MYSEDEVVKCKEVGTSEEKKSITESTAHDMGAYHLVVCNPAARSRKRRDGQELLGLKLFVWVSTSGSKTLDQ